MPRISPAQFNPLAEYRSVGGLVDEEVTAEGATNVRAISEVLELQLAWRPLLQLSAQVYGRAGVGGVVRMRMDLRQGDWPELEGEEEERVRELRTSLARAFPALFEAPPPPPQGE